MIKGRYVCQVEVDYTYDETKLNITADELKERVNSNWMEKAMEQNVRGMFDRNAKITVTRMLSDICEVGNED